MKNKKKKELPLWLHYGIIFALVGGAGALILWLFSGDPFSRPVVGVGVAQGLLTLIGTISFFVIFPAILLGIENVLLIPIVYFLVGALIGGIVSRVRKIE